MEFPLIVLIISPMINSCIGVRFTSIKWTNELNRQLLNIYYGASPLDEGHLYRMKAEWDRQLPQFRGEQAIRLRKRVQYLMDRELKQWQTHPMTEQKQIEDLLRAIYLATNDRRPHHEERMVSKLFEIHPEYRQQFDMMRAVVHKWYKQYAPLGKEMRIHDINWTPQHKADLLHIANQVRIGTGALQDRLKSRWLQMYHHLNVNAKSLITYMYKLRKHEGHELTVEEKNKAKRRYDMLPPLKQEQQQRHKSTVEEIVLIGKKLKWTRQLNANLLFIHQMIQEGKGSVAGRLKERWSAMYNTLSHMSGENLQARVKLLQRKGFKPTVAEIEKAREEYKRLPPFSLETTFKGRERTKSQQLRIHEVHEAHEASQQHQDAPNSPNFELTPEELMWLRQVMEDSSTSHIGQADYPHQTFHHGSSSHTPIQQAPSSSQIHVPNPYYYQWDQGSSSSQIPIQEVPSSSQIRVPSPYHHQWDQGGNSSQILIQHIPSSSQICVPSPYHHQWDQGGNSSQIPIQHVPSSSKIGVPSPYHHQWDQGGNSSQIPIQHVPSSSQIRVPSPYHHQWDQGSNSSQIPIQHVPSRSQIRVPSPYHRQWDRGSSSSQSQHPPQ